MYNFGICTIGYSIYCYQTVFLFLDQRNRQLVLIRNFFIVILLVLFGARVSTFAQRNMPKAQNSGAVHYSHKKTTEADQTTLRIRPAKRILSIRTRDESNHLNSISCPSLITMPHYAFISAATFSPAIPFPSLFPQIPTPPPSC